MIRRDQDVLERRPCPPQPGEASEGESRAGSCPVGSVMGTKAHCWALSAPQVDIPVFFCALPLPYPRCVTVRRAVVRPQHFSGQQGVGSDVEGIRRRGGFELSYHNFGRYSY